MKVFKVLGNKLDSAQTMTSHILILVSEILFILNSKRHEVVSTGSQIFIYNWHEINRSEKVDKSQGKCKTNKSALSITDQYKYHFLSAQWKI